MKRIAIFQDNLDVGGIQKSLANLIWKFDYDKYQVDLYLSEKKIFFDMEFPERLTVKYLRPIPRIFSLMPFDLARKLVKLDFSDCEEYDLAIDFNSYQFSCALGALSVPAKKRVMWIHNNVGIKLKNEWKYRVLWFNFRSKFKYYDQFVGVSEALVYPFKSASGLYDKKYSVIQNTINTEEIYVRAEEETDFSVDESKLNFVALGRLCHQKAYDIMLRSFAEACERRDDLHLYIIGDGEKRFSLEYLRDSLGLTDKVTFLGQQPNPFKFMQKMDCFLSTSRYEGQPVNIMEAKAIGLPLYCTKNLEQYTEGLVGYEDITEAICSARRVEKHRDALTEYNAEIMRRIGALAEADSTPVRRTVHIISLHLGVGGVEKAICSMANLFAERYNVEIRSVYNMPGSPAFPVDSRVKLMYMLSDVPNRVEWKEAARNFHLLGFIRESWRGVRILASKKLAVIRAIHSIRDGIVITTRHEDNLELSRFGRRDVVKIAQLHHDHRFDRRLLRGFRYGYGRIDVFALLTPQLVDEVREIIGWRNRHTELVYMPNFLEHFPEDVRLSGREKTVLAAGRLSAVKRFDLLIREFVRVHDAAPDWTLRILGEGEDRAMLEDIIRENGAESYIVLAGRKNGEEVEEEMRRAAIYAMSSRTEGFPFVLMEAQSCGLPILAYDVRVGPGFLVKDGVDGYLVPEGNEAEFEKRLIELMSDEVRREAMGAAALQEVRQFSEEKVAERWYSVIG